VGGTCELEGLVEIVADNIGLETFRAPMPQFITPFGIALSCLEAAAAPGQDKQKQQQLL